MTDFHVEPLDASFGATVTGLKLADLDETTFSRLYDTWLEYALLIFPDQHLSNDQQVEFAKRFGELEFDLVPISNVKKDGSIRVEDDADEMIQVLKGNMGWHCDSTYMPVQAKGAVFTAQEQAAEQARPQPAQLGGSLRLSVPRPEGRRAANPALPLSLLEKAKYGSLCLKAGYATVRGKPSLIRMVWP